MDGNIFYTSLHLISCVHVRCVCTSIGELFEDVYKEYCKAELIPPSPPTNTQPPGVYLYCGYCKIHTNNPTDLEDHCKTDVHKYAVFADSGRDVLWQFEPPPEDYTSVTMHGYELS